ncbi:MAG: COX15/CtaA family protein [Thermoleophilia bacterium]|nr:COX15/CtaA family protein [Gaiellaceae bacterium]MDW8337847.1 COX15/CtaA family protein [Thermoleophilia bacterium]
MEAVAVRARTLSPERFLALAITTCVALGVVVASGAFVRLTGSGLGCENWPRCGDKPYPEAGFHAWVEFGNRIVALVGITLALVTWVGSRRVLGLSRWARLAALGAFLVAIAQIPMGGVTVALELHPLAVMTHFLLGLAVLGLAVIVVVEAWSHLAGRADPVGSLRLRRLATWIGLPLSAALVVTGAVATASGPHPGASADVERLGVPITETVYVHVRAAAAFGIGLLILGWLLSRLRARAPGVFRLWLVLLAVTVLQAILGEVQYRSALPWGLVLVHVVLAAAIFAGSLALVFVLWRPPAPLLRPESSSHAA